MNIMSNYFKKFCQFFLIDSKHFCNINRKLFTNFLIIFSITKVNDIALLKLEVPQASGRSENHPAMAMNIPTNDMEITGKYCTVSGWGRLKSGGFQRPHILRIVDVLVPSNDVCAEMLGSNLPWDR